MPKPKTAETSCEGPECAGLAAISLVGSELKLSVLHSLMGGPKRFNELRISTGMCQSSLAKTLKDLEDVGVAERKVAFDRPLAVEYHLSAMGLDLTDAIRSLEIWAHKWVAEDRMKKVTA
jgi:DNA-binding HxlR family transcriptional regulator